MSLAQQLIDLLELTKERIGDWDQRSALGIADNFVHGSNNIDTPLARFDESGPLNRDGLAASFIDAIGTASPAEASEALQAARRHLNAPFANDPKILKWREERAARYPKGIGVE